MSRWEDMFFIDQTGMDYSLWAKAPESDRFRYVGTYRTYHYAKNRAKFFFKKEMRKIERLLLSR